MFFIFTHVRTHLHTDVHMHKHQNSMNKYKCFFRSQMRHSQSSDTGGPRGERSGRLARDADGRTRRSLFSPEVPHGVTTIRATIQA